MTSNTSTEGQKNIAPQLLPNFRTRQWLLVAALCIAGLWLVVSRNPVVQPEFESVSMAGAKADYYLESFTLMNTNSNGDTDYTLKAETLIHLPTELLARVNAPFLTVNSNTTDKGIWELTAKTGLLPDNGLTVDLLGDVQLQQRIDGQTPVRLTTPSLRLDREQQQLTSDNGVEVQGLGWQLQADKMTGEIETGKLIFRDNNHAQYTTTPAAN